MTGKQIPIQMYSNADGWGTRWRSSFRHVATSRKVVDTILDGVNWNFSL